MPRGGIVREPPGAAGDGGPSPLPEGGLAGRAHAVLSFGRPQAAHGW